MTYKDIGFSNIRLPSTKNNSIYIYNSMTNTFPEEVFVHEFLHTLERLSNEYGIERPELHDNEKYGYKEDSKEGLKKWYCDYMCKNIKSNNGNIGLDKKVYEYKPVDDSNFDYAMEIEYENEPENMIEEIRIIIKMIFQNVEAIQKGNKLEGI